jgi:predicted nucleotidyltransferase
MLKTYEIKYAGKRITGQDRCICRGCPRSQWGEKGHAMKPEDIKRLQSSMEPIFRRNEVFKAVLFGSAVRDTETKRSDIDLMIVMETDKRFFDRYDAFDEIFELMRGTSVDLLIYTPQELENISHRPFIRKIISEGKTIYEH